MKSTPSATDTAGLPRPLLQAGFGIAGSALALRAAGIADFERGLSALPSLCLFHRLTGLDCPGCGMTRAFLRLAHGDLAGAWHLHPFSIPLFALFLALAFAPPAWIERAANSRAAALAPAIALALLLGWWACFKLFAGAHP